MSSDLKWLKRLDPLGMPVILALGRQRQGNITSQGGVQPGIYKALCLTLNCALHVQLPPSQNLFSCDSVLAILLFSTPGLFDLKQHK